MPTFNLETQSSAASSAFHTDPMLGCSRMLLAGITTSVLVLRSSGEIVFANPACERMIGRSTAELEGQVLSAIFQEDKFSAPVEPAGTGTARRGRLSVGRDAWLSVKIDIAPIHSAQNELQGSVVTIDDLSDLLQMDQLVKQISQSDPLTGLPREEALYDSVEAALTQLHVTGRSFALLQLNVDKFRRISESLGHDAADNTLREVAARLAGKIRPTDVLARASGDGFTLLLNSCESQEDALTRADLVLKAFDTPFQLGPYCTRITASIGMSFARPGTLARAGLFTEAELAVRRCKALGGNRVVCFDSSMADWRSHAVQMESNMQKALVNQEFYVVYQPQICCKTGHLIGVEALLRWQSPQGGLVMPTVFIPAAEESGLIVSLGEWCMRKACEEVVALQKQLGYSIRLAVNVSPKQVHSLGFKDFVRQTLQETGLNPRDLELEITEGLLMSHEEEAQKQIRNLQELGLSVAMDDFGMGFSNLSYITRFKIDRLKIDRSFVSHCLDDHNSRMITTSLIFLAKSLGIEVVAEGVETRAQAALLSDLQCDLAQGYLFSRPTTAGEIYTLARQNAACVGLRGTVATAAALPPAAQALHAFAQAFAAPAATGIVHPAAPAAAAMSQYANTVGGVPLTAPVASPVFAAGPVDSAMPQAPAAPADPAAHAPVVAQAAAAVPATAAPVLVTPAEVFAATADTVATPDLLQAASGAVPLASSATAAETAPVALPVGDPASTAAAAATTAPAMSVPEDAAQWLRFSDDAFATHTILVAPAEPQQAKITDLPPAPKEKIKVRQVAHVRNGDPIEPRDPVCRPTNPPRVSNAMRVRWVSVPVRDLPN